MFEDKPARSRISGRADLLSQLNMMIRALLASPLRNRLFGIGGAVFLVVAGLVIAATLASALAWSGVGLIAFVPLVGLAVFPLQIAALLLRGVVFEYLGLTALGAYLTLYQGFASRRTEAVRSSRVRAAVQHPA